MQIETSRSNIITIPTNYQSHIDITGSLAAPAITILCSVRSSRSHNVRSCSPGLPRALNLHLSSSYLSQVMVMFVNGERWKVSEVRGKMYYHANRILRSYIITIPTTNSHTLALAVSSWLLILSLSGAQGVTMFVYVSWICLSSQSSSFWLKSFSGLS